MDFDAPWLKTLIQQCLQEDIGPGDHSSLASILPGTQGHSRILFKEPGILAGIALAQRICSEYNPEIQFDRHFDDGAFAQKGDVVADLTGPAIALLSVERLILNFMQRLSAIATQTREAVDLCAGFPVKVLDTRKTTPGLRLLEKWAVKTGGGENHRIGLYDMIMLKDNHVDSAGGIRAAIERTAAYQKEKGLSLGVEIETRSMDEVQQVLDCGGVTRIMLDNFKPGLCREAVALIDRRYQTEASGGINRSNLRDYAATGVDFISLGYLTHSVKSLDISMKTKLKVEN